jgi:hypothetical protein
MLQPCEVLLEGGGPGGALKIPLTPMCQAINNLNTIFKELLLNIWAKNPPMFRRLFQYSSEAASTMYPWPLLHTHTHTQCVHTHTHQSLKHCKEKHGSTKPVLQL